MNLKRMSCENVDSDRTCRVGSLATVWKLKIVQIPHTNCRVTYYRSRISLSCKEMISTGAWILFSERKLGSQKEKQRKEREEKREREREEKKI